MLAGRTYLHSAFCTTEFLLTLALVAQDAWQQLNEACSLFEVAAPRGPTYANLLPRIQLLRQKAHDVLVSVRHIEPTLVPLPPDAQAVESSELNALGTSTQLSRGRPRTATVKEEDSIAITEEAAAAALSFLQPAPWQTLDFGHPAAGPLSLPQYAHPQQHPQPPNPSAGHQQRPISSDNHQQQHASSPFGFAPPGVHPAMPVYQPYSPATLPGAPGASMPLYLPSQPPAMYGSSNPAGPLFGSQEATDPAAYRYATQHQAPNGGAGPAGEMAWHPSGTVMEGLPSMQGPQDSWSLCAFASFLSASCDPTILTLHALSRGRRVAQRGLGRMREGETLGSVRSAMLACLCAL